MSDRVTVVWKVLIAMFAFSIMVWSITLTPSAFFLIYLTHWMIITHATYLIFQAFIAVMVHNVWGRDNNRWLTEERLPWYAGVAWFTCLISIPGGFLVCVLYWNLLNVGIPYVSNYFVHGTVWAVCTVDFLLGMQPYLWIQFIWFVVWGLVYGTWTVIQGYSGIGNGYPVGDPSYCECVYSILNWNKNVLEAALYAYGLPIVIVPLFCSVIWCLNFARYQAIYKDLGGNGATVSRGEGGGGLASKATKGPNEEEA
jgi:hypothetical protein